MRMNKIITEVMLIAFFANSMGLSSFAGSLDTSSTPPENQTPDTTAQDKDPSALPAPKLNPLEAEFEPMSANAKYYGDHCLDEDGKLLPDNQITDVSVVSKLEELADEESGHQMSAPVIPCAVAAALLEPINQEYQAQLKKIADVKAATNETCVGDCKSGEQKDPAFSTAQTLKAGFEDSDKLSSELPACVEDKAGTGNNRHTTSVMSCMGDFTCNLLRSIPGVGLAAGLAARITESAKNDTESCVNINNGSCLASALDGAIKDLWGNVTGIWSLLGMAGSAAVSGTEALAKMAGHGIAKAWDWTFGIKIENKTSEAGIKASQLPPSAISEFMSNPWKFMKNFVAKMIAHTDEAVRSFGCAEWTGTPYMSTCISPMDSWYCASCDQIMNTACGVLGAIPGEAATALLTGGVLQEARLGGRVLEIATQVMKQSKIRVVAKSAEVAESAAVKVGATAAGAGRLAVGAARLTATGAGKIGKAFARIPAVAAIHKWVSEGGFVSWLARKKGESTAVKFALAIPRAGWSAAKLSATILTKGAYIGANLVAKGADKVYTQPFLKGAALADKANGVASDVALLMGLHVADVGAAMTKQAALAAAREAAVKELDAASATKAGAAKAPTSKQIAADADELEKSIQEQIESNSDTIMIDMDNYFAGDLLEERLNGAGVKFRKVKSAKGTFIEIDKDQIPGCPLGVKLKEPAFTYKHEGD